MELETRKNVLKPYFHEMGSGAYPKWQEPGNVFSDFEILNCEFSDIECKQPDVVERVSHAAEIFFEKKSAISLQKIRQDMLFWQQLREELAGFMK